MKRREFIAGLGGVAAWPIAARAQQPTRMRRIGVLTGFSDVDMQPLLSAFREKLNALGWTEGRDIAIDVRPVSGDYSRTTQEAGRLIGLSPDVIVAQGTPGLTAVLQQSQTAPVVFVLVADPVRQGLIQSLARPGGHATGFTNFEFSIGGKWLDLLREIDPQLKHITLISNPGNPNTAQFSQFIERAGRSIAIDVVTASVHNAPEIEAAITDAAHRPDGGLIIFPDSLTTIYRDLIIGLAARHRLPAVYPFRIFSSEGGLVSYGLDFLELYRQAATYVDRVLRGEKPADLPVQAPTKFELVINLKTAKALGLTVPPIIQMTADEVIE